MANAAARLEGLTLLISRQNPGLAPGATPTASERTCRSDARRECARQHISHRARRRGV